MHERISQGEGVRGPKEKKRVPGWSTEEMKERPKIDIIEDAQEPERNGFMLEEFWLKEWRRKSWTSTRLGGTREQEIQNKDVERRLLGKNFLLL